MAADQHSASASEATGPSADLARFDNDYAPRVNFGARLEPASGVIHGAGQDPVGYREYSELFDEAHRPMMLMTYITVTAGPEAVIEWRDRVRAALADLAGQGTTLQIGLNLTAGKDDGSGRAGQVAEGAYDEAIDAFVDSLRSFGVPTWVRIGYEFEGSWNGYTPEGYVAAFRFITDRMRAAEVEDIATVWCAAGGSAGFIPFDDLMNFYPGDEYVDWWGVDTFSPEELTNPWLGDFYDLAAKHRKPVMIGEATPRYVGADKGAESWNRWFRLFLVPGMNHCAGGAGAHQVDWLTAMEDWAEDGVEPESLPAAHPGDAPFTRPLCAHPLRAVYDGDGDPGEAASFQCMAPSTS